MPSIFTKKLLKVLDEHLKENEMEISEVLGSFAFIIWNLCEEPKGIKRLNLLSELFTEVYHNEVSRDRENVQDKLS